MRILIGVYIIFSYTQSVVVGLVSLHIPLIHGIRRSTVPNRQLKISCASSDQSERYKAQEAITNRREILRSIKNILICTAAFSVVVAPSSAISPQEAAVSYDTYASNYDTLDGGSIADFLGINEARIKIIGMARGKVLEIGAGTGLNLDKYKFASGPSANDGVSSLTLLDISDGMLTESKKKAMSLNIPNWIELNFITADATSSSITDIFGKGSFDTVVDTFSFCVMGRIGAQRCLQQMRNVVKAGVDGGQILLIENTKSSNALLGLYQDVTADTAAKMGGKGCVYNQDVRSFITQTDGLALASEEEYASGVFRSFVCIP